MISNLGHYDTLLQNLNYKMLENVTAIYYKMQQNFVTKCVSFLVQNLAVLYRMRELLQIKTILISNVTVLQNETLIIKGDTKLKALKDEKLYSPQSLINI